MQKQKHQPLEVELRMSCRNLKDTDIMSKSDPFVKVELVNSDYKTIQKLGKTEQLENELNPQFAKPVLAQYLFQKSQLIKFQVKDDDDGPGNPDDDLGKVFIPLGEIVQAGNQGVTRRLKGKGEITVKGTVTNLPGSKNVQIRARAEDLDKKDLFGKSDGFYELYCQGTLLCRSNVVDNQTHPTWQSQSFPESSLNKGTEIEIKVYDWDDDSSNDLIGIATFQIEHCQKGMKLPLINPKKKYKKKKTNSGVFIIDEFKIVEISSFYNFLESGLELNFHCAIDFTGSNGDPKGTGSLHYKNNGRTQYSDAVYSVGQVVEAYDFDKKFGSYGFGGFITKTNTTEHVFPLDQRTGNYEIPGISNIINSYFESFAYLQLSGPTNFSPVISHVMRIAEKSVGTGFYHALMILTDGAISDMAETLNVIKKCEKLPMSIIIIGIGNADFSSMEQLDGDGGTKKSRDLVQFVAFNDVNRMMSQGQNGNFGSVNELLAAEVLAELPKQVEKYFMNNSMSHKLLVRRNGHQQPRFVKSEQEAAKFNSAVQSHPVHPGQHSGHGQNVQQGQFSSHGAPQVSGPASVNIPLNLNASAPPNMPAHVPQGGPQSIYPSPHAQNPSYSQNQSHPQAQGFQQHQGQPQNPGYPPQNQPPNAYPPQNMNAGYPQNPAHQQYPGHQQNPGYPQNSGYPQGQGQPQHSGYPPQNQQPGAYPPQNQPPGAYPNANPYPMGNVNQQFGAMNMGNPPNPNQNQYPY